jgi:hypothetical protein
MNWRPVIIAVVVLGVAGCALRDRVDLNTAPLERIAALPGLTVDDATRVVANRPYYAIDELVVRQVIDPARYGALADDVCLGPPAMPAYLRGLSPLPEGP